jgi:hypothetical protein
VGVIAALGVCAVLLVATKPWRDDARRPSCRRRRSTRWRRRARRPLAAARGLGLQPLAALRRGRLYALLGVTRADIWRQLRDDHHNLAELARAPRLAEPEKLAAALVAPRPAMCRRRRCGCCRAARCERSRRAPRAAPLLPLAAPVRDPQRGARDLRRHGCRVPLAAPREQSPLDVGRVHGRSPSQIQALAAAVLRERVRAGVRHGAMTARQQAASCCARQLAQLPRWLAQVRYTGRRRRTRASSCGCHATTRPTPRSRRRAPRRVRGLPAAPSAGPRAREISVQDRTLGSAAPVEISQANRARRGRSRRTTRRSPRTGGLVRLRVGRWKPHFAKRYGSIRVFVRDVKAGVRHEVGRPGARSSQSEFNPAIAPAAALWPTRRFAFGLQPGSGDALAVAAAPSGQPPRAHGPAANADTVRAEHLRRRHRIAFTTAARTWAQRVAIDRVRARPQARDGRRRVSRSASSPAISADGRRVCVRRGAQRAAARSGRGAGRACERAARRLSRSARR